ncbi:S8 family serine peptidase [Thermocrispum municipale]|uniref:S8 family serine peptidase n=1 Tax=Thermocrispum municipale TaxID=37926 RepID=UPI0024804075|nr:S8 family serine peptidase [Thermocrispum municipale]
MATRRTARVGAAALTFLFGIVGTGLAPTTAAAQQSQAEQAPPWAPRGPIPGPPQDKGGPDKQYRLSTQCIESSFTAKEIPSQAILKEGPWAQRFLRIREVQNYVRERSENGKVGWNPKKGKPMKIAVIDTGVTPGEYLPKERVEAGGDYVQEGDEGKQGLLDCDGHGTQVAGIIAGNPNNPDIGFTGVAPDATILSIRQSSQNYTEKTPEEIAQERKDREERQKAKERERKLQEKLAEQDAKQKQLEEELEEAKKKANEKTSSSQTAPPGPIEPRAQENPAGAGNLNTLAQAIVRAVKKGADVINMSVDACRPAENFTPNGDEKKVRAALKYAADNGVVAVVAAGNAATPDSGGTCLQNDVRLPNDPRMPAKDQPRTLVIPPWFSADGTVLAVGAIGRDGSVADFSMRGPWVSVAAPGTEIISIDPAGTNAIINATFNGDRTKPQPLQGTSFAAPYVAGVAALVKQMHPDLPAREVIRRIERTAQHPGAADGRDQFVGYGIIDPVAAVTAELPEESSATETENKALPSDLPPLNEPDPTPMYVALGGTAGAALALSITLFAVRSVRRSKRKAA